MSLVRPQPVEGFEDQTAYVYLNMENKHQQPPIYKEHHCATVHVSASLCVTFSVQSDLFPDTLLL